MSLTIDNVEIKLDYPDAGWIDMHILVNGEEKELINLSDVYEPFEDIKEWLENIVSHVFDFTPFGVNIYDESYNYIYCCPVKLKYHINPCGIAFI